MTLKRKVDITILIPTYFRTKFWQRLLKFYLSFNYDINIIILDSTPINKIELISKEKLLKNKFVEYFHYSENIKFSAKIIEGLKKVKTEYSVICADDDYLIPDCLEECTNFLQLNHDYTSANGITCIHDYTSDKKFKMFQNYTKGKSLKKRTAKERFFDYYIARRTGIPVHYNVHRTSFLKFIWEETNIYAFGGGYLELFPQALSVMYGKMKMINMFYQSKEKNYSSWATSEQYKAMHSEHNTKMLMKGLVKHLSIVDNLTKEESEIFFKKFNPLPEIFQSKTEKKNISSFFGKIFLFLNRIFISRLNFKKILYYFTNYPRECPFAIYPKGLSNYNKVKQSVISANLSINDLNEGRDQNIKNANILL